MGDLMSTLHIGVVDQPYSYRQEQLSKRGRPMKRRRQVTLNTTTGDVAEILEAKYHPFEHFYEDNENFIAEALLRSVDGAAEALLSGAPLHIDPYGAAASEIQDKFKEYLFTKKLNFREVGVPTQASLRGVNHRLAHPYAKGNAPRPSFIDTGNYENSMRVYVE